MQNKYVFASGDTHSIYLHGFIVGESLGSQIVHASVIYSEKDLSPKSVPFYFLFIYFCLSLNILSLACHQKYTVVQLWRDLEDKKIACHIFPDLVI